MRLDFMNKVALVTGASSGIGAAIAMGLAELGGHVVLHYNNNKEGAEHIESDIKRAGGSASLARADLTSSRSAAALVNDVVGEHGRIDVLVNNAGDLVKRSPVTELSDEDYQRIMDVNLTSVFATCRSAVPIMQRQGSGSIINLTSQAARTGGGGGSVVYATSKGAVSTFTRGLAKEVATSGVRVNAIAPGIITTPFHARHTAETQMKSMLSGIPMARAGTPEECVGAALFLAFDEMSGYVTGQVIEVNGGQITP